MENSSDTGVSVVGIGAICAGAAVFVFALTYTWIACTRPKRLNCCGGTPTTDTLEAPTVGRNDVDNVELGGGKTTGATQDLDSRDRDAGGRNNVLTPVETWNKVDLLFPHLHVRSRPVRSYTKHWDENLAIQHQLQNAFDEKVEELSTDSPDEWETLTRTENAEDLCVALGMCENLVSIRFRIVRAIQQELDLPSNKTNILDSIQYRIDTIHIKNPWGRTEDIDGKLHSNYRQKVWLTYLGFNWKKEHLLETLGQAKDALKTSTAITENGFFVHGASASKLELVFKADGRPGKSKTNETLSHDFGEGHYCFRADAQQANIEEAMSFAVDRIWVEGKKEEGKYVEYKIHNPALVIHPSFDHTLFDTPEAHRVGTSAIGNSDLDRLTDEERDKFLAAREKWENEQDDEIKNWKDFVKIVLCYQSIPLPPMRHVYYGWMHSCQACDKPTGDREPVRDRDLWIQYCFTEFYIKESLGKNRIFVEFNLNMEDWLPLIEGALNTVDPDDAAKALIPEETGWT